MKYNFSLLKNKNVCFKFKIYNKDISLKSRIIDVKQNNKSIMFILENGKFEILQEKFKHMILRENNNEILLIDTNDITIISPFIGFSMFDTYGFPIEITNEMLEEKGYVLDIEGCNILRKLQKEMSQNTFKNKNAF